MASLELSYPQILQTFGGHLVRGETENRAFLCWFLEHFYRLEGADIYDSVCDKPGDKGIDGIYLDEQLRQIDFFQAYVAKSEEKTQGDKKLKQFAGSIAQFSTTSGAAEVLKHANPELQSIAKRIDLISRIEDKYEIRGIYITNAESDVTADTYLKTQPHITLYDSKRLQSEFVSIDKIDPIANPASFDISGIPSLSFPIGANLKMVIAPILASELVKMSGIPNGDLFAWNVRQWLGRKTAVNKSVAKSIQTRDEHKYFPAFHNGITILCKKLNVSKETIEITGYAVVNGCQSITSLNENKSHITSELRILTKFIEIEPNSDLAKKITDHTNNQNGITARDLQSNGLIQTRLQSEIHRLYPEYHYRIKRGEHPEWPPGSVIENELLARIILAFDLDRPETWSHNYKLFGDFHSDIFGRKEVNADRAIFLFEAYSVIIKALNTLEDTLFAQYTLTRWLLVLLVREALKTDKEGTRLCANPSAFMNQPKGRENIKECIGQLSQILARLLNGATKRIKGKTGFFDHKNDLKNRDFILYTVTEIIPQYQVMMDGKLAQTFSEKWNALSKIN